MLSSELVVVSWGSSWYCISLDLQKHLNSVH